jgi:hypothetical protein
MVGEQETREKRRSKKYKVSTCIGAGPGLCPTKPRTTVDVQVIKLSLGTFDVHHYKLN